MSTTTYIIVAIVLLLLELLYFKFAARFGIVDRPSKRGSSQSVVLRGGGIIFPIAALLLFFVDGFQQPLFILGLLIVSVLSFIDDIRSLSPKLRLPIQFVGMLMLVIQLLSATDRHLTVVSAALILIIGLIVCTGAMNVFNFMDGINGITGGYAFVVLCAILYVFGDNGTLCGFMNDYVVPGSIYSLAIFALIADLVFCFFNFRKHARCFAGDVGSVSIAFIILFLLGFIMVETNNVSWLAFIVVFGVDGSLTIIHRLMLHENISLPHRKHAYQIMANELHIPHLVVSLVYMALQAACCAAYIVFPGYVTLLVEIAILSLAYIAFMLKFYHLHAENGNA